MESPPPLPPPSDDPYVSQANPANPPAQEQRIGDDLGVRVLLPVGRSGWAIAAGYFGLFSLIVFPAPIALILSIIAIRDIKKSKNTDKPKYGMGRAVFGLVMGILGTIIILIGLFNMS